MFTQRDKGQGRSCWTCDKGRGVGSQNTLAAQLGGDPGLHVPKSTNWNLPPWSRLACSALQAGKESTPGTKGRAFRGWPKHKAQCLQAVWWGSFEVPKAHLRTELLHPSGSTGPRIPCKRPRAPTHLWPGLAQWVGWLGAAILELGKLGLAFSFFCSERAEGVCPCPATVGIRGALLPSSGDVLPIPPAASRASVNMAAGWL